MGRRGRLGNHVISICFDSEDEEDGEFLAMNFYRYCRDLESGQVAFLRDPAELENMLRFGNTVRGKGEPTNGAVKVQQETTFCQQVPTGPTIVFEQVDVADVVIDTGSTTLNAFCLTAPRFCPVAAPVPQPKPSAASHSSKLFRMRKHQSAKK